MRLLVRLFSTNLKFVVNWIVQVHLVAILSAQRMCTYRAVPEPAHHGHPCNSVLGVVDRLHRDIRCNGIGGGFLCVTSRFCRCATL